MRSAVVRLFGLATAWVRPGRAARLPVPAAPPESIPAAGAVAAPAAVSDMARLAAVAHRTTTRLWKLAFAAPSQTRPSPENHRRLRDNVVALLEVDTLDARYFPRRPVLLPQVLQAVNDPHAASERISRMVSHDPVLAADVLRLANSSHYRTSSGAIETIQRAIVVCGVDALRGMLATAMLRPVFRATRKNFPRFPRVLWERTERAARAAELYALHALPQYRCEAQLLVLLNALGPLVVYGVVLDVYARNAHFSPSADLCVELIGTLAPRMSQRLARAWQISNRLSAALEGQPLEPLSAALQAGELLGTLAFLESKSVIGRDERCASIVEAGLEAAAAQIWSGLSGRP